MKRMGVLFGQRRLMVLVTLTVLVLAAAALVASSASFTATSANPDNVFTAGALSIGNYDSLLANNEGNPVVSLSASAMAPGDVTSGTAIIKNTGTVSGTFSLTSALDPVSDPAFATLLQCRITQDGTQIYNGNLDAIGTINLTPGGVASWAPAAQHTYTFAVTFPSSAGNGFQGDTAEVDFAWDAVSD